MDVLPRGSKGCRIDFHSLCKIRQFAQKRKLTVCAVRNLRLTRARYGERVVLVDNFAADRCLNIEQVGCRGECFYLRASPIKRTKIVHTSTK
ncbi:hypothetical protein BCEN4_590056 [Burkholderia cenocepacia]|nr:hypothetical protein BCEN4_590056 [Burkholderia cenocepacia]